VHVRVQIASILFAASVLLGVLELVRRRYLRERYAILWLAAAGALLVLAIWKDLLNTISKALGIYYPPNAFFVIAFGFLLVLLLHFSAVVSRMSDQARVLAQRLALLEQREQVAGTDSVDENERDVVPDADARVSERRAEGPESVTRRGGDPAPLRRR
jgi:hypothetical protein